MWLEVFKYVQGDEPRWVLNMTTGKVTYSAGYALMPIASLSRHFKELTEALPNTYHRIIVQHSALYQEYGSYGPRESPVTESVLRGMESQVQTWLDRAMLQNRALDIQLEVEEIPDFDDSLESPILDYLIEQEHRWGSLTISTPLSLGPWSLVAGYIDKIRHSAHWSEVTEFHAFSRDPDIAMDTIMQQLGETQLHFLDIGFNMGQSADHRSHLTNTLDGGMWKCLTTLHLKYSSYAALALFIGQCAAVETVWASITSNHKSPLWYRPDVLQHTALQSMGVVIMNDCTDSALNSVLDGLCCPNLSLLSIACSPGVVVGLQDEITVQSVLAFLDRSGCTPATFSGCIHFTDSNANCEEWEDRLEARGLQCCLVGNEKICYQHRWGIQDFDWYY
ncbi:hypothetical protein AAF712_015433 [Marasmius tenuissimus]|uniref:Uncharacterized protein n=1 Tax=Marasmius tenuissimus TaxID=585030 RepID=A0ABR2Z8J5_9AGAR